MSGLYSRFYRAKERMSWQKDIREENTQSEDQSENYMVNKWKNIHDIQDTVRVA